MKKLLIVLLGLMMVLGLSACGEKDEKMDARTETKADATSKSEEETKAETKVEESSATQKINESATYSGMIIVGEDIPVGSYDIKPAANDDTAIKIFEDENAKENDVYKYEWLFPADDNGPADELKSYVLRKGYILDISDNAEFKRVK